GQLLRIFLEIADVQLVEPPGPDREHALRNVLKALLALGRRDDDLSLILDLPVLRLLNLRRRRGHVRGVGAWRRRLARLGEDRRRERRVSEEADRQRSKIAHYFPRGNMTPMRQRPRALSTTVSAIRLDCCATVAGRSQAPGKRGAPDRAPPSAGQGAPRKRATPRLHRGRSGGALVQSLGSGPRARYCRTRGPAARTPARNSRAACGLP